MKKQPFGQNNESLLDAVVKRIRLGKVVSSIPHNSLVIDLGCGYKGYFLKTISSKIKEGIGFDLEVDTSQLPSNITLKITQVDQAIPLPDNVADIITALAIVEHVDNPRKLYQEAFRILKPGGKLIITTPSKKSQALLEFMAFKLKIISCQEITDHKRYYDLKKLKGGLIEAGFNQNNIVVSHFELGLNILAKATK